MTNIDLTINLRLDEGMTLDDVLAWADDKCSGCANTDGDVCDLCVVRTIVSKAYDKFEED